MALAYTPGPLAVALQLAITTDRELEAAYNACSCEEHETDACPHLAAWRANDVDAALDALRDSGEPRPWELSEEGCHYDTVLAASLAEALDLARDAVDASNYDDASGTLWIGVSVTCPLTGETDSATAECEPDAPPCEDGREHDFQAPYAIVGGLKENPGVWGHGGGIVMTRVCMHCGCARVTDTWAQDPSTGEQGLTSVAYDRGRYADEVAALAEAEAEARCEHPRMSGNTCEECGESCSSSDVGAEDDGICHDSACPIHGES